MIEHWTRDRYLEHCKAVGPAPEADCAAAYLYRAGGSHDEARRLLVVVRDDCSRTSERRAYYDRVLALFEAAP